MNKTKLIKEFCKNTKSLEYNIQKKRLREITISQVLFYLCKERFVVEIDDNIYDILFEVNKENGEIGRLIKEYPNNTFKFSSDIIDEAFKKGKWFMLTDEDLTNEELIKINEKIETRKKIEELKNREKLIDNILDVLEKKNKKKFKENRNRERIKQHLMSLTEEEFLKLMREHLNKK